MYVPDFMLTLFAFVFIAWAIKVVINCGRR